MRLDTNINNHEKSQALLGRFRDAMMVQSGLRRDPFDQSHVDPTTCTSLPVCQQNRQQLSREVDRKLQRLQDVTLDDVQLRLLNEETNKLVRQFDLWNYRIRQLGGTRQDKEIYEQGTEVVQRRGFRFYGRARELPEAKEKEAAAQRLLEEDARSVKTELLLSRVDDFYYNHEPMDDLCLAEIAELEKHMQSSEGPFEFCGTKRISCQGGDEMLLPDFDIPTPEEAQVALLQFRKERLVSALKEKREKLL